MGDPQTVAGQLAGRGDEVARLRAERDEQGALLERLATDLHAAQAERDRLAARVAEVGSEGMAMAVQLGIAEALLRRAAGWTVHVAGEESALEDGWLADARAFLEAR